MPFFWAARQAGGPLDTVEDWVGSCVRRAGGSFL